MSNCILELVLLTNTTNMTEKRLICKSICQFIDDYRTSLKLDFDNYKNIGVKFLKTKELSIKNINDAQLETFYLSKLNSLLSLDISNNSISTLNLHSPNLTKLNISGTDIKYIDILSNCPNLSSLNISRTNVKNLFPLRHCVKLEHIDVSYTGVNDISVLSY